MAQFDVYVNPSQKSRPSFPFVVDIQSPIISEIVTRIVVPLGKQNLFKNEMMNGFTPEIEYEEERLLLLTPQIASLPTKALKNPVGSLALLRDEIIAALDFAITGI